MEGQIQLRAPLSIQVYQEFFSRTAMIIFFCGIYVECCVRTELRTDVFFCACLAVQLKYKSPVCQSEY